tara:strand:+ start:1399 stop:1608 length:210 start_codon:yes stop_codon:yes gene_type:complete
MKKIYIDTSDVAEVKQEKLDDRVTIGYDKNDKIVGVEISSPLSLDIDDDEVITYETLENTLTKSEWGEA